VTGTYSYILYVPVTVSHALKDILLALQKFSQVFSFSCIEANEIVVLYI
jgi:hypothetical protein